MMQRGHGSVHPIRVRTSSRLLALGADHPRALASPEKSEGPAATPVSYRGDTTFTLT